MFRLLRPLLGGLSMSFRVLSAVLLASSALVSTNAMAADFGGDCCADLEERVAELEATTARKGNRKVSLTIYGQVNTAVMFWDNGKEDNVYVVDNDISSTRFGFKGKAKITPDWSAGYKIEIEAQSSDSNVVDEDNDDNFGINLRKAEWYLKSKTYGKMTVGQGGFASDGAATVDLSGTNVIAAFDDLKFGERLDPISAANAFPFADADDYDDFTRGGSFEFNRGNRVRYDSPTFAGFILSAAWGEDDAWDVALRYAGAFGDFKLAAAIAYGEVTELGDTTLSNDNDLFGAATDLSLVTGSASIIHNPTGLFLTAAAAWREFELANPPAGFRGEEENTYWAIRGGISQRFIPLGKTAIYAEYQKTESDQWRDADAVAYLTTNGAPLDTEVEIIGGGLVQKIDAAAMELYLGYRHVEIDDNEPTSSYDDLDVVTTGARIKF